VTTPTEGRGSQHRRKIKIVGTHSLQVKPSPTSPLPQVPTIQDYQNHGKHEILLGRERDRARNNQGQDPST
jgi:hypothetical protein